MRPRAPQTASSRRAGCSPHETAAPLDAFWTTIIEAVAWTKRRRLSTRQQRPFHDDALGLGVMRSRDGGRTWESLNTPELTCRKIASLTVDPHRPARLYAGTGGNGVFVLEP